MSALYLKTIDACFCEILLVIVNKGVRSCYNADFSRINSRCNLFLYALDQFFGFLILCCKDRNRWLITMTKGNIAFSIIDTIVNDPEPGSYYSGRVTRIMDFGAFVEIAPGKEGLVHISQLDIKRTENVTDVVNVGDIVKVKVLEIDDKGRLNLSRREALIDLDGAVPENVLPEKQPRRERSDRPRGDRPRRDRNDRH